MTKPKNADLNPTRPNPKRISLQTILCSKSGRSRLTHDENKLPTDTEGQSPTDAEERLTTDAEERLPTDSEEQSPTDDEADSRSIEERKERNKQFLQAASYSVEWETPTDDEDDEDD